MISRWWWETDTILAQEICKSIIFAHFNLDSLLIKVRVRNILFTHFQLFFKKIVVYEYCLSNLVLLVQNRTCI